MPLPALATGIALIDQLVRLFVPVNRMLDDIHTSDEERARAKSAMMALQNEALGLALALERESLQAKSGLIAAEANGASWLQRNWRPITMLSFLGLVIADSFGLLAFRLADQAWLLLQIGLGGYVVGRSVEKISPHKKTASIPEIVTEINTNTQPPIHGNSGNTPAKVRKR